MAKNDILIFIPTYNEGENIESLYREIKDLNLDSDILFIDDNSQDGTREIIDDLAMRNSNIHVIHRPNKMGIGSAHLEGIGFAYKNKYKTLITMDCDFTHKTKHLANFLTISQGHDLILGSRYIEKDSLKDWNLYRKFLTHFGHFLTMSLLKIPYDATGAYRLYNLDTINPDLFKLVKSRSYSFFFESLYILLQHKVRVKEIAIELPKRCYGHSKMNMRDICNSLFRLAALYIRYLFRKDLTSVGERQKL